MRDSEGKTLYLLSDTNKSKIEMLLCSRHCTSGSTALPCTLSQREVSVLSENLRFWGRSRGPPKAKGTTDTSLKHAKLWFQWFVKIQSVHLRLQSTICFLFSFWFCFLVALETHLLLMRFTFIFPVSLPRFLIPWHSFKKEFQGCLGGSVC